MRTQALDPGLPVLLTFFFPKMTHQLSLRVIVVIIIFLRKFVLGIIFLRISSDIYMTNLLNSLHTSVSKHIETSFGITHKLWNKMLYQ